MKKYWSLLLSISFLTFFSCIEDKSEYSMQGKEEVNVDEVVVDTTDTDEKIPEGHLAPGLHLVKIKVLQGQDSVERQFKYYMPVSIDVSKPISLLFELHGSYEFETGDEVPNPINNISETHSFNQKAIKENYIICYPAGWPEFKPDSSGAVNWAGENYTRSLPFMDAMLKYFTQDHEPSVDPNRIYTTGQSSGAIFSFALALHRSEQIAAIAPRAGQSASTDPFPSRAVPVRVFAGEKDNTVQHAAVITNMTKWAEEIGGYFAADMQTDTTVFEDYADVTIRYWHGGYADYEIYSLAGIDHGISENKCKDAIFEFLKNHPLDNASTNLFVTTSIKDIDAQCGEKISFKVSYTQGADLKMTNVPKGWEVKLEENTVAMTAPLDYFGNISRKGSITFTVTSGNQTPVSCEIPYNLNAPKTYFEVGDIYYNDDFEPVGVVWWVNEANIREAKIIGLENGSSRRSGIFNGNFTTPDTDDGEVNTAKYVKENIEANLGSTAANCAIVWASEYSYKGVNNWYLPAINEVITIYNNRELIKPTLEKLGATLPKSYCLSSTVTMDAGVRSYHEFNFSNGKIALEKSTYADPAILVKKVTMQ